MAPNKISGGLNLDALNQDERKTAHHKIMDAGEAVKKLLEKARGQIRASKEVLGIPDSSGLFILVIDSIPYLAPHYVDYYVKNIMKKDWKGIDHYPQIDAVLVLMRLNGITVEGNTGFYFTYPKDHISPASLLATDAIREMHRQHRGRVLGGFSTDDPNRQIADLKIELTPPKPRPSG